MKCFLDLDGVLVDWHRGTCKLHSLPWPFDDPKMFGVGEFSDTIDMPREQLYGSMGYDFWLNLEPTAECFDIVKLLEKIYGRSNICILTSPLRTAGCAQGKIDWIKKHIPQYARQWFIGKRKEFCAHSNAVLIDDKDSNIDDFRNHGGHGVLVPRAWNSLYNLRDSVLPYLEVYTPNAKR